MTEKTPQEYRYHAFISYRHADNKVQGRQWATWLHQSIETYEVPKDLVGTTNGRGEIIPERIYPIFRDEEELPAHADLGSTIVGALEQTNLLVVLCSPRAVASTYVADEIDYFKKLGRSDHIIAAIIDGEPNTSWDKSKEGLGFRPEEECFPRPLQFEYDEHGNPTERHAEPIAADFRINNDGVPEQGWTTPAVYRQYLKQNSSFNKTEIDKKVVAYQQQLHLMLLKIIAGILGVPLGELTRRDKEYQLEQKMNKTKKLKRWISVVSMFAILAIGSGIFAYLQKEEAFSQEKRAIASSMKAKENLAESKHNLGLTLEEKGNNEAKNSYRGRLFKLFAQLNLKPSSLAFKKNALSLTFEHFNNQFNIWSSDQVADHTGGLTSVAFSPDGETLITGSYDGRLKLWDVKTGVLKKIFDTPGFDYDDKKIMCVAYHPDAQTIVAGLSDGSLKLWDVKTGSQIRSFKGHTRYVSSVTFSPDGQLLLSGSYDKTLKLWDVQSGELKLTLKGHQYGVTGVAFSPDSQVVASSSIDNTLKLWDVNTGQVKNTLEGHQDDVRSVAFSPKGKYLASASDDKTVKLWDVNSGKQIKTFKGHLAKIRSVAFSPDGKSIVSGGADKTIILWDTETGSIKQKFKRDIGIVASLAYSPDGHSIVSVGSDRTARLWNISTGKQLSPKEGHVALVNCVTFSPNGLIFVSSSADGTIKLWDATTGKLKNTLVGHRDNVRSVAFSPRGEYLASASDDKTIKLWDVKTGELKNTLVGHRDDVRSVAFSPDGKTIVSGSSDKTVKLWDVKTGVLKNILEGHLESVNSVAFSPDGMTIVSGSSDKTVKLWDVKAGVLKNTLGGHLESVNSIAFSPDGKTIVSGSSDSTLKLWDVKTGVLKSTLKGHSDSVESVAFSPNGQSLVSGSYDETLKLWDVKSGELVGTFKGHLNAVSSVSFSPDGQTLISGSRDNTVKLWSVNGNGKKPLIKGHLRQVSSLEFSPDGKTLVSAGYDWDVKLWDANTGVLKNSLTEGQQNDGYLRVAFSPEGESVIDNNLRRWDISTGRLESQFKDRAKGDGFNFDVSPDGKMVIAPSDPKGNMSLLDADTGTVIHIFKGHSDIVYRSVFSPDGSRIASSSKDNTLKLWNVESGILAFDLQGHSNEINDVVFSPDSLTLASASKDDGTVILWDVETGSIKNILQQNGNPYSVAFSPDGSLLASGTEGGIKFWDVATGALLTTLDTPFEVLNLAFSPDGKTLASDGIGNDCIKLWDLSPLAYYSDVESIQLFIDEEKSTFFAELKGTNIVSNINKQWNLFSHQSNAANKWLKNPPIYLSLQAQHNDSNAMVDLSDYASRNNDDEKAKNWLEKAVKLGNKKAKQRLQALTFGLASSVVIESINPNLLKSYAIELMTMANDLDVNSLRYMTDRPRSKTFAYDMAIEENLLKDKNKFWEKAFPFLDGITNEEIQEMNLKIDRLSLRKAGGFDFYQIDAVMNIPNARMYHDGKTVFYLIDNKIYWRPFGW